jgi:hypothetical protein
LLLLLRTDLSFAEQQSWGSAEVGRWLEATGTPHLVKRFADEGVDGKVLRALSTHANGELLKIELQELGLVSLRMRVLFMGELGKLGLLTEVESVSDPPDTKVVKDFNWRHLNYKCGSRTCSNCLAMSAAVDNSVYGGSIVVEAFEGAGYGRSQSSTWNVLWTHAASQCIDDNTGRKKSICAAMLEVSNGRPIMCNQCNFFLGAGQKCIFAQHLRRVIAKYGDYGILPIFDLSKPEQLAAWVAAMRADTDADWVLKPCVGGASEGVEFVRAPAAMSDPSRFIESLEKTFSSKKQFTVAQRFLSKPFLIDKRKFHARVYVLLTGYHPFYRAWVSSNGFIFHSTSKHDMRHVPSIVFSQVSSAVLSRPLSDLWTHVREVGGDPAKVWADTRHALNKIFKTYTHTAPFPGGSFTEPFDRAINGDCFDLFGVDVLYDEALTPYVLEVNSGPNIKVSDQYHEQQSTIKKQLVQSIVRWVSARQAHERLPLKVRQKEMMEGLRSLGIDTAAVDSLERPKLEHLFAMALEGQALANASTGGAFEWLDDGGKANDTTTGDAQTGGGAAPPACAADADSA